MSEIIKTINSVDPVTIQVTVNTASPLWSYAYQDRGTNYSGAYNDGLPHTHAIGFPHELHLETDAWTIQIINADPNAEVGYQVRIDWFQNMTLIHSWSQIGTVATNDLSTPGNDGIIV